MFKNKTRNLFSLLISLFTMSFLPQNVGAQGENHAAWLLNYEDGWLHRIDNPETFVMDLYSQNIKTVFFHVGDVDENGNHWWVPPGTPQWELEPYREQINYFIYLANNIGITVLADIGSQHDVPIDYEDGEIRGNIISLCDDLLNRTIDPYDFNGLQLDLEPIACISALPDTFEGYIQLLDDIRSQVNPAILSAAVNRFNAEFGPLGWVPVLPGDLWNWTSESFTAIAPCLDQIAVMSYFDEPFWSWYDDYSSYLMYQIAQIHEAIESTDVEFLIGLASYTDNAFPQYFSSGLEGATNYFISLLYDGITIFRYGTTGPDEWQDWGVKFPSPPLPSISSGSVNPQQGNTSITFDFSVVFTSPVNLPPLNGTQVVIDDETYELTPQSSSWSSGVEYMFSSQPDQFSEGTHYFHFEGQQGGYHLRYPTGSTELQFTVGAPSAAEIDLDITPSTVQIGEEIVCTVWVEDEYGNPLPDVQVSYSDNGYSGYFTEPIQQVTNAEGMVVNSYIGNVAGYGQITVTTLGGISDSEQFEITGSPPIIFTWQVEYSYGNWNYNISFEALYENGSPVSNEQVTITSDHGYFGSPGNNQVVVTTTGLGHPYNDPTLTIPQSTYPNGVEVTLTAEVLGCSPPPWIGHLGGNATVVTPFSIFTASNYVYAVDWQPNGDLVAVGQHSYIRLYNKNNWEYERSIEVGQGEMEDLVFSPDGSKIACISNRIHVFDLVSGNELAISGFSATFRCLDWSPDGNYIAAGDYDGGTYIFNTALSQYDVSYFAETVWDLEFHPTSNLIAAAVENGNGQSYIIPYSGLNWGNVEIVNIPNSDYGYSVSYSPSGNNLVLGTEEYAGYIYNCSGWGSTPLSTQYQNEIMRVSWSPVTNSSHPSYNLIAAGDDNTNGRVVLYNAPNGAPTRRTPVGYGTEEHHAIWSPDGDYLIFANGSGAYVLAMTDNAPPNIGITSHSGGQSVSTTPITLEGTITDPNTITSTFVQVNGPPNIPLALGTGGSFSQAIDLDPGTNVIEVFATDGPGNSGSYEMEINYEIDTEPPLILWGNIEPDEVLLEESFTITAKSYDVFTGLNGLEVTAYITEQDGDTLIQDISLFDDGDLQNHGDIVQGDSIFSNIMSTATLFAEDFYNLAIQSIDCNQIEGNAEQLDIFLVLDLPVFANITNNPQNPANIDPVTVNVDVTDGSEIADVSLHYSVNNQQSYYQASMILTGGDTYEGEIPAASVETVYYYIKAIDIYTNTDSSDVQSYSVITPPSITLTEPNGG